MLSLVTVTVMEMSDDVDNGNGDDNDADHNGECAHPATTGIHAANVPA